ncbi:hypothetical protein BDQ17DRAFT_1456238 [Cyathus striatus]|nr:hypothetical protein BDQ17DRAFT_1456238 [Cyathus striatus]
MSTEAQVVELPGLDSNILNSISQSFQNSYGQLYSLLLENEVAKEGDGICANVDNLLQFILNQDKDATTESIKECIFNIQKLAQSGKDDVERVKQGLGSVRTELYELRERIAHDKANAISHPQIVEGLKTAEKSVDDLLENIKPLINWWNEMYGKILGLRNNVALISAGNRLWTKMNRDQWKNIKNGFSQYQNEIEEKVHQYRGALKFYNMIENGDSSKNDDARVGLHKNALKSSLSTAPSTGSNYDRRNGERPSGEEGPTNAPPGDLEQSQHGSRGGAVVAVVEADRHSNTLPVIIEHWSRLRRVKQDKESPRIESETIGDGGEGTDQPAAGGLNHACLGFGSTREPGRVLENQAVLPMRREGHHRTVAETAHDHAREHVPDTPITDVHDNSTRRGNSQENIDGIGEVHANGIDGNFRSREEGFNIAAETDDHAREHVPDSTITASTGTLNYFDRVRTLEKWINNKCHNKQHEYDHQHH